MAHKVSIIIPAFNEEKYLPVCLDSISKLDWPKQDLEVIVIDNGSRDQTCKIAETWGAILLKDSTKNVSGLRNLGAQKATGDILAFVDADCVVAEDWLKQSEKYFSNSEILVWGGPPVPPESSSWVQKAWFLMVATAETSKEVDWIGTVDFFVKRIWFERIGGFNEQLLTCEDVDFCYQILKFGKIVSDNNIRVIHLREADSVKEFFYKEVWRGASNLKGVKSHGFSIKELPSLMVPFYFGGLFPLFCLSVLFCFNLATVLFLFFFLCLPALMAMVKVRKIKNKAIRKLQLCFLIYIYFFARTYSLFSKKK